MYRYQEFLKPEGSSRQFNVAQNHIDDLLPTHIAHLPLNKNETVADRREMLRMSLMVQSAGLVIATYNQAAIGFGTLLKDEEWQGYYELDFALVRSDHRSQGVYKELTTRREGIAKKLGGIGVFAAIDITGNQEPWLARSGYRYFEQSDPNFPIFIKNFN